MTVKPMNQAFKRATSPPRPETAGRKNRSAFLPGAEESPTSGSFYIGVFVLSGLLMALQVLQARIFSVTTWYHLSFLIIGVAMFGLTLGALHVHRGDAAEQRATFGPRMARSTYHFAVFVVIALAAQMVMPIVSDSVVGTLVTLPLMSLLVIPPYYCAGIVLSLAITRAPFPTARTYGVDLLGAAAGCLWALMLVESTDAPSAVLVLSLAALAASRLFAGGAGSHTAGAAALVCAALALNVLPSRPAIYPLWIKDRFISQDALAYDQWNSISRVTLRREEKDVRPALWGPSPRLPKDLRSSYHFLNIDGDAGTPLTRFGGDCRTGLDVLDYDVTTIAYALPNLKRSAVIGVGGGRDVLSACHAGISDITALDVNAIQISLLTQVEPFKSYTNISGIPGVRLIHSEARSWFSRNPEKFDLVQMSLVDTWAATGAGAFALSESGLYTVEAWTTFLNRLDAGGVLTVSRWYIRDAHSEAGRVVSLAVAALIDVGARQPARHVFVATSGSIATLVLARDPLSEEQLDALEKRAKAMDFGILISPRQKPAEDGGVLAAMLTASSRDDLERLAQVNDFDISPPTDMRPFFFNQVRVTNPRHVYELIAADSPSGMLGFARAILNLYVIIGFSLLMVVLAILLPLRRELRSGNGAFVGGGTAWFLLIGLGFMLLEISLLQRMSIYLGHPAYGLSIVLFGIVLSTGVGSLISDRWPLATNRARFAWIAVTAVMAVAEIFALDGVTRTFADVSLPYRAFLCTSLIVPLGCLLGFGFPTGMALVRTINARPSAWFWGINGAAGVMGSVLAVALNIAGGFAFTMLIGALCYALLAVPAWRAASLLLVAPRSPLV
jgi:spermidine synthase